MRLLTHKDGYLSSCFDKIDKRESGNTNSSLKHMLIDNHTNDDNEREFRAHLPLEHVSGFEKHSKNLQKASDSNYI